MYTNNSRVVFAKGDYYIADTITEESFCHVQVFPNPTNFRKQIVRNLGAKAGQPPSDYMKMESKDFHRLNRQMQMDKQEQLRNFNSFSK